MNTLTFEQLPSAVRTLTKEVSELKQLIITTADRKIINVPEQPINIKEAAIVLGLAVPTIYSKASKGELPYMKRGKRLYFSRTELLEYIKGGKRKSSAEIDAEADAYLFNKKIAR